MQDTYRTRHFRGGEHLATKWVAADDHLDAMLAVLRVCRPEVGDILYFGDTYYQVRQGPEQLMLEHLYAHDPKVLGLYGKAVRAERAAAAGAVRQVAR